jgi:hypothetical protein
MSSRVQVLGSTCTSIPRSAMLRGVFALMPRSTAATVNRFSPRAGTTYGASVETSPHRSAPSICGDARTRSRASAGISPLKMPTRIAPRSRRCRVSARVSMPLMPTTPWLRSSSSSDRVERQLERIREGSRTT